MEVDCDDCDEPSSSEKDTFSEGEERRNKKSVSGHRESVFLRDDMICGLFLESVIFFNEKIIFPSSLAMLCREVEKRLCLSL